MKRWNRRRAWMGWLKGALLMPCLALGATGGEGRAQGPRDRDGELQTVRGTVESMTTAPRGEIDGAVLDDGTVLHWPPHLEDRFAAAVQRGHQITAVGFARTGREGQRRLEVRTLTNVDTNTTVRNDDPDRPSKHRKERAAPPRRVGPTETIRGTIERMTTAPRGEVDGAMLEDGTLLHWPPHLEDRFAEIVKSGDRVEAVGFDEITPKGDEHFEVTSLKNLGTDASAENDGLNRHADARPPRPRDLGRPPARENRAERIRELKRQLEHLEREIEELERDR